MTNFIWITAQKDMIHNYPLAPKSVAYLRNEHRHLFKFKIYIEVFHDDRDIEFILFKQYVNNLLIEIDSQLGAKSCEMISDNLHKKITTKYPKRFIRISVSEDGENGVLYDYPINQ